MFEVSLKLMKRIDLKVQFKRDIKRVIKRGRNYVKLAHAVELLASDIDLPARYQTHKLKGRYIGMHECHIEPDWLLIYEITATAIILHRTGSHADLFEKS
jgi:mRNA interferase YafQ